MKAEAILLVCDVWGTALPKKFIEHYSESIVNRNEYIEEIEDIVADSNYADDAWETIVAQATLFLGGRRYTIFQDGDVWAIPVQGDVSWVPDEEQLLTDADLEGAYDDYIDGMYESVMIAGYRFTTSYALRAVDPIAYRCGLGDWLACLEDPHGFIELGGKYYNKDAQEPYDYASSFFDNSKNGEWEWQE